MVSEKHSKTLWKSALSLVQNERGDPRGGEALTYDGAGLGLSVAEKDIWCKELKHVQLTQELINKRDYFQKDNDLQLVLPPNPHSQNSPWLR